MSTLLCVPILVHDEALALRDAQAAKDAGADLVEFRIDDLFTGEGSSPNPDPSDSPEVLSILRLIADSPLPCIVTCRPAGSGEGGTYDGPDDARISLFQRLGTAFGRLPDNQPEHPPRYLDVEFSTWQRSANIQQKIKLAIDHPEQLRDLQTSLILSTHDFKADPPISPGASSRCATHRRESSRSPTSPAPSATTSNSSTSSPTATAPRSPWPWASPA